MAHNPGPQGGTSRPAPRKELIILVGGLIATAHASVMITAPVMPHFMDVIGGSVFEMGLAYSFSSLGRFLVNIPAGMLAERIGRKPVIIVGSLLILVFGTLSGWSPNPYWLWAFRFLIGIGSAMAITIANVVAADISAVENRGRILGLMQAMQLMVGLAAPSAGGFLSTYIDVRAPFYLSGAGAGLFALWGMFRLPETKPEHVGPSGAGAETRRSFGTWALLKDPSFLAVCLIGFATFFLRTGGTTGLAPAFLRNQIGVSDATIGLLFTAASVTFGVLVYPSGWAADRWGRKIVMVPTGMLIGIGFAAMPFVTTLAPFAAVFLAYNMCVAWGGQTPAAYVGDISPLGQRGVAFGMYRTFGDAAGFLGPIIMLGLADALSYKAAFAFGAVLWTLSLLFFARVAKESAGPRRSHPQSLINRTPIRE